MFWIILLNTSDSNERCHFWVLESILTSSGAELLDTLVAERMYIEVIRVRVESDEFYDDEPGPPKLTEGVQVKRVEETAVYRLHEYNHFRSLLIFYWQFFLWRVR
jgi:hypothetical protein